MDPDARTQHVARERVLTGRPVGQGSVRAEIRASWSRVRGGGLGPGDDPAITPLTTDEIERRRTVSPLAPYLPHLRQALRAVVASGLLVVVTDADGWVLWRTGDPGIRRHADRLGFVGGSAWTEHNVGTNAIGTSLVLGEPVMINGAEHYVEAHTRWSCAAAPVQDPWTGEQLGVVDVSGGLASMHPSVLALVTLAARTAELEVRAEHQRRLERLRAHAAPLLARIAGRAAAVDASGHLAAAVGFAAPERLQLPASLGAGPVRLPLLGHAVAEPLPGGWLLHLGPSTAQPQAPTELVLDLSCAPPRVSLHGSDGGWEHELSGRHAEILAALLRSPAGRSAAQLAEDLFADPSRVVTVRAEVSRLRRLLGPVLAAQPYRVADGVQASLRLPDERARVLPRSSAPVAVALRAATP